MLPPERANILKPEEINWLKSMESRIDAYLEEKFSGAALSISLPVPPHRRDIDILLNRYRAGNWKAEYRADTTRSWWMTLAPSTRLNDPGWPDGPVISIEEHGEIQTVWERLEVTEGDPEPV